MHDDAGYTIMEARVLFRRRNADGGMVGKYSGVNVYTHYDDTCLFDQEGWYICDLYLNPKTHGNYFAKFVRRMTEDEIGTASFDENQDICPETAIEGRFGNETEGIEITRISENELSSPLFGDGNYRFCICPSGERASLWPDKYGRVTARNGIMSIGGLAKFSPFKATSHITFTRSKNRIEIRLRGICMDGLFVATTLMLFLMVAVCLIPEYFRSQKCQEIRIWALKGNFVEARKFESDLRYRGRADRYGRFQRDEPGCYIILVFDRPVTNGNYFGYARGYVGQSKKVYSRVHEHLRGSHRKEIHRDYESGRHLYISIIPCKEKDLDDLETSLIRSLDWKRLYNQKPGDGRVRSLESLRGPVGTLVTTSGGVPRPKQASSEPQLKDGETVNDVMSKAMDGSIKSQFKLGYFYENGKHVPMDPYRAEVWYSRAAGGGHPMAAYRLSLMYRNGKGIPKDEAKADTMLALYKKLQNKSQQKRYRLRNRYNLQN